VAKPSLRVRNPTHTDENVVSRFQQAATSTDAANAISKHEKRETCRHSKANCIVTSQNADDWIKITRGRRAKPDLWETHFTMNVRINLKF